MEKICTKCSLSQPINNFSRKNDNRDGLANYCKCCSKNIARAYREVNKNNILAKGLVYYNKNKERILNNQKIRRDDNQYNKKYYNLNRSKILVQKKSVSHVYNKHIKGRKTIDILFKLKCNMRTMTYIAIRGKQYTKKSKTQEILGCSFEELKIYLESKWEPWMNWNNHGKYNGEPNFGWDIDHIIPLSSAKTEEELLELCHYTNIQPLCSLINRVSKRNKSYWVKNS